MNAIEYCKYDTGMWMFTAKTEWRFSHFSLCFKHQVARVISRCFSGSKIYPVLSCCCWSYKGKLLWLYTIFLCSVCNGWSIVMCCVTSCDRVYRIEKHTQTPMKYMFPNFETLNWFAAQHILDTLRGTVVIFTSVWLFFWFLCHWRPDCNFFWHLLTL